MQINFLANAIIATLRFFLAIRRLKNPCEPIMLHSRHDVRNLDEYCS